MLLVCNYFWHFNFGYTTPMAVRTAKQNTCVLSVVSILQVLQLVFHYEWIQNGSGACLQKMKYTHMWLGCCPATIVKNCQLLDGFMCSDCIILMMQRGHGPTELLIQIMLSVFSPHLSLSLFSVASAADEAWYWPKPKVHIVQIRWCGLHIHVYVKCASWHNV